MSNQILGSYEFDWNPDRWMIPKAEKFSGQVLTYEGAAFFSFGVSIIGKEIVLEWDWMGLSQWNQLDAMYQSDEGYLWTPGDGHTYNVEIPHLDGAYFEVVDLNFPYRKAVKLTLMIMSVVGQS